MALASYTQPCHLAEIQLLVVLGLEYVVDLIHSLDETILLGLSAEERKVKVSEFVGFLEEEFVGNNTIVYSSR